LLRCGQLRRPKQEAHKQEAHVKRRQFLGLLGSAAAYPVSANAQGQSVPIVGFVSPNLSSNAAMPFTAPFREGLVQGGFVEGRTVAIEEAHEGGQPQRIAAAIAEFVRRPVSVIVALGTVSARAAKSATASLPIVFATGDDPVTSGLVDSINRPGQNLTGVAFISAGLGAKRLQLLNSLVPEARLIGLLADQSPESQNQSRAQREAAQALGVKLVNETVASDEAIDRAFAMFKQQGVGALSVASGPYLSSQRDRVVALAARHEIPALYTYRAFADGGGLISYGASFADSMRQAGLYAARILRGARPGDLPVIQATKFELMINLKAAKALRLNVPPMLLALADEVIE
jgi:putative ABC transport system substrate-binding protein